MKFRSSDYHWTEETSKISDRIRYSLEPILEYSLRSGMTLEQFYYLVGNAADELVATFILDKKLLDEVHYGEVIKDDHN